MQGLLTDVQPSIDKLIAITTMAPNLTGLARSTPPSLMQFYAVAARLSCCAHINRVKKSPSSSSRRGGRVATGLTTSPSDSRKSRAVAASCDVVILRPASRRCININYVIVAPSTCCLLSACKRASHASSVSADCPRCIFDESLFVARLNVAIYPYFCHTSDTTERS